TKSSRRPVLEEAAAELNTRSASPKRADEAAQSVARLAANDDRKLAIVTTAGRKPSQLRGEPASVSASPGQEDRSAAAVSTIVATASRKHHIKDSPTLPMELPLSRKPIERDGDNYKRLKAAMTARRDALMPVHPEPGIEVVKVQQALYPPGGDALIYDQDRKHLQQRPLAAAEKHMMAGEVRAFFQASWNASSRRWTLLDRAADGSR
ncbi:MAG TPA: hypothetical protein VGI78_04050, partial [Acetobacteraceae bacterium]